jgi:uncharacterized membrane protein YdjX (TVP38/TMEM64 family)
VNGRLWIALLLLGLAAALFALGSDDVVGLDFLKQRHAEAVALYRAQPLFVLGFMALHVTALTLCLPGAVLTMALAGGAIFGLWPGALIVLTSVTIGDTMGMLAARTLLRDLVRRRFGAQLAIVEQGVERDGVFYLFGLRMAAVIPFFVVNLTMGLTRMPVRVFAPVSFVGVAPATMLYVAAGTGLAGIEQASDVLSPPPLLATLAAIGILPILVRLIVKRRRAGSALAEH